ncbi:LOW QUALITY PROTEIN: olfactory receptor 6J1 [Rhynchonycteris naso]
MPVDNQTTNVGEFVLLEFLLSRQVELLFLLQLRLTFLKTLLRNLLIISTVLSYSHLHTAIYFFLCRSILDILFTAVISPVLVNLTSGDKAISFAGCIILCYFYFFLGRGEFLLLTVMLYDRYATVCYLLQSTLMSPVCIGTTVFSWVGGFPSVLFPTILISQLPFCGSSVLKHFCNSWPWLVSACVDTTATEQVVFMLLSTIILCCIVCVVYSYMHTTLTGVTIPSSSQAKKKAFNTCASHLTTVMISGGITIFICVTSSQNYLKVKVPLVLSSVVNSFLNPFIIYTLRNDLMLGILKNVWVRIKGVLEKRMMTMLRSKSSYKDQ